MGDRCNLWIMFAAHDADMVAKVFDFNSKDGEDFRSCIADTELPIWDMNMDEVNWGGTNELEKLASMGVWFIAGHGDGCDYGAERVVGYKRKISFVQCDRSDRIVCAVNDRTGKPEAASLKFIKTYLKRYKLVNDHFEDLRSVKFAWKRGGGAVCR